MADKLPLYGIDQLPDHAVVTIVDGKATCDAANEVHGECVTWSGENGTYTQAFKNIRNTDWNALKDRKVYLWADNNAESRKAMGKVRVILEKLGVKSIIVLDAKHKPDNWNATRANREDCTELVSEHGTSVYPQTESEVASETKKYFQFLGLQGKRFYFYVNASGQVLSFTGTDLERSGNQLTLADGKYWEDMFSNDSKHAANCLIRNSERKGFYDAKLIRGRGVWIDGEHSVLNTGNRLIVDGEEIHVSEFQGKFIYEQGDSMSIQACAAMDSTGGQSLIDICRMVRWADPISGSLLAGWIFSSIICGSLPWRSHIYIIGAVGAGKTWVLENILEPTLEGIALTAQSKSSEAGVRQTIGSDARPVIFDEAEAENPEDKLRMQRVFDLARQASSEGGAPILKGTASQTGGIPYVVRSCFCFASIVQSQTQYADETRTTIMRLAPPHHEHEPPFEVLEEAARTTFTSEYRNALISRAVSMMPIVRENALLFARTGQKFFGSRRASDQYGMMLAGLYALTHDEVVDDPMAFIETFEWIGRKTDKPQTSEDRLMDAILQHEVRWVPGTPGRSVAEVIDRERRNTMEQSEDERMALRKLGIKLIDDKLYIAISGEGLRKILKDTQWSSNWSRCLINIKDAKRTNGSERFAPGVKARAIVIPMPESITG